MKVLIERFKPLIRLLLIPENIKEKDLLLQIWESEGLKALKFFENNSSVELEEGIDCKNKI